jgi:hypothetical protein
VKTNLNVKVISPRGTMAVSEHKKVIEGMKEEAPVDMREIFSAAYHAAFAFVPTCEPIPEDKLAFTSAEYEKGGKCVLCDKETDYGHRGGKVHKRRLSLAVELDKLLGKRIGQPREIFCGLATRFVDQLALESFWGSDLSSFPLKAMKKLKQCGGKYKPASGGSMIHIPGEFIASASLYIVPYIGQQCKYVGIVALPWASIPYDRKQLRSDMSDAGADASNDSEFGPQKMSRSDQAWWPCIGVEFATDRATETVREDEARFNGKWMHCIYQIADQNTPEAWLCTVEKQWAPNGVWMEQDD